MKMTDMRAKARAIFGPAIAEPMPKQPNGAKALQERANARPIPTYKVGGVVKKKAPPQPTAAERAADRKRREEYAKMKVTKEQGAAITRGNRAAAIEGGRYKTGGKVQTSADTAKKLATEMGGMKKGGNPKKNGLAVMIAIGSPTKGMKDMKRPMRKAEGGDLKKKDEVPTSQGPITRENLAERKAANTASKAITGNLTGTALDPRGAATMVLTPTPITTRVTGIDPAVAAKYNASRQGIEAARVKAAEDALKAKYSSATPNRDASAKANPTTQASTPASFDRNKALKDFSAVSRNFFNQGVPLKEITRAQGELRKLQMNNSSTPAQHQAAIQQILARMNSLIPKKAAKGGIIKKKMGGMAYAKGGEMMKPVKKAQGGAGKVRKGMMSPEGKIIDAMNKVRGK
jgi:hypothetical protein